MDFDKSVSCRIGEKRYNKGEANTNKGKQKRGVS